MGGANDKSIDKDIEKWKLEWRLINSFMQKQYIIGELQLDSLLTISGYNNPKFIVAGMEMLLELNKKDKIISILNKLDQSTLEQVCNKDLFSSKLSDIQICTSLIKEEIIENKELQIELIKMYVDDQAARDNLLTETIAKHKLNPSEISNGSPIKVDRENRDRLKEIIKEYGFPTIQLVGKEAMAYIPWIIQHADEDKEWQKQQLPFIENAVEQGEMDPQVYAYLYDRIKVNSGEKQLYGTQCKNVNTKNKTVVLEDVEDIENLDKRRMEVGIMPIEMYKQFMLNMPK